MEFNSEVTQIDQWSSEKFAESVAVLRRVNDNTVTRFCSSIVSWMYSFQRGAMQKSGIWELSKKVLPWNASKQTYKADQEKLQ